MRRAAVSGLLFFTSLILLAGRVEKIYFFNSPTVSDRDSFQLFTLPGTRLSGFPGEPMIPWQKVVLMLPPGESAVSIEVIREGEEVYPGTVILFPQQPPEPLSATTPGNFIRNKTVYLQQTRYPSNAEGHLSTQYLNGYVFALCTFTPVSYIPATGRIKWYKKVTVRVVSQPGPVPGEALNRLTPLPTVRERVMDFAQNPEMISAYPQPRLPVVNYSYLIISPTAFQNSFQSLTSMYAARGITCRVITLDSIYAVASGIDNAEKIRNFIIGQQLNHNIQYVLLAGNPPLIPYRGMYCYVQSGSGYSDAGIPADLYFSGLDGTYDFNGNHIYGEVADSADLLPDLAVGRFPVNDTAELRRMIRKTISYLTNPVLGELNKPLLAAEYLYNDPVTFGGPFMNLLVNDHSDNGYFTHGIPEATNIIDKLYDTLISPPLNIWYWPANTLIAKINQGRSFIHHLGHASTTYMLKTGMSDISDSTFYAVNGIDHNFTLLYTQGCYDGQFEASGGCIGAKSVTIDNFLVAGIFNSRYGWFNQGTSDGPSEHLQREFVSVLYHDTLPDRHLGEAHRISKVETAPWVSLPGEFEPGAQRWVHYCCNVFGDPALEIWTAEPDTFTLVTWTGAIDSDWHKTGNWSTGVVPSSLYDVKVSASSNPPVITTVNTAVCHNLTLEAGATLTIQPGKSMIVRGDVILSNP